MLKEPRNRLSEKAIMVWRFTGIISSLITLSFLSALVIILSIILEWYPWLISLACLTILVYAYLVIVLLPKLRWRRWRYEVREDEVEIQQGVIIVKKTLIPMIRVQHVDMKQGPFLRKYNLATIVISTAATTHEIPALEMSEAEEIRQFISNKVKVAEEDV